MKARSLGNPPGNHTLDVRLLDRRKALQCLHAVRGRQHVHQLDIERLAARLVALGPLAPMTLVGALEREDDPIIVELAAGALEWMVETHSLDHSRTANTLRHLVVSANLPDSTRMRLLVTLNRLGVDMRDFRYADAFDNFAGLAETSREEILSEIAADESLLGKFLEEIGELSGDAQLSLIEDYAQSEQPIIYRLYRLLGRSNDGALGAAVVDALKEKRNPAAAAALAAISEESLSVETRKRALRAVRAMQFAGIRAVPFRAFAIGPVYSSVVSTIDGAGSRMVWIARERPQGKHLLVVYLMINDREGIKDCFGCANATREEYEVRLRALRDLKEVAVREMEFEYCVELVRDALACNQQEDIPVPPAFLMLMDIFSDRRLDPEPFVPSFDDQNLKALKVNGRLIQQSAAAIEMLPLRSWFSAAESLQPLAFRANRLTDIERPSAAFQSLVTEQLEQMVCHIIRRELAPGAAVLRRRLEIMVDFFLRSGACSGEDALALLAAAQHLPSHYPRWDGASWPEGAIPAEENPLLFAIARRSLENAQAALRLNR